MEDGLLKQTISLQISLGPFHKFPQISFSPFLNILSHMQHALGWFSLNFLYVNNKKHSLFSKTENALFKRNMVKHLVISVKYTKTC